MNKHLLTTCMLTLVFGVFAYPKELQKHVQQLSEVRKELKEALKTELSCWYSASIDTLYGGFLSDFSYNWKPDGAQNKFLVTQARHIWSTSNAAMYFQKDTILRTIAQHGVQFLKNTLWDSLYGGFYDLVSRSGEVLQSDGAMLKKAYGNAFAIYGLSTYFRASHDTQALQLAQQTFNWLERCSYDSVNGGYYQFITRESVPLPDGYFNTPPKDYNSTIHLLEAFTELYRVWNSPLLRSRLEELLHLVRDRMTDERGFLKLFFTKEWNHISYQDSSRDLHKRNEYFDHISFGHDIETAYLMLEASEVLYNQPDERTLTVAKKLVDHVLQYGWDTNNGGVYDRGYYYKGQAKPVIIKESKEWWGQVEALNSLLLFAELYPNDPLDYEQKFFQQWNYCKQYLIDTIHGGFYWGGLDKEPQQRTAPKASIWKGNYHTTRSLINCLHRLRSMLNEQYKNNTYEPVNNEASPEARQLLAYLYSIKGKYILAGHHNDVRTPDRYPQRVKELTGKKPAVWGADFIHYYQNGNAQLLVEEATRKYNEGYIVTLMWHAGRPQDNPPFGWKESVQAEMTDEEWKELLTPGSLLHNRWLEQIDTIAYYLQQLRDRHIPVLWRPYHELNGIWFWWGGRPGPEGSLKLYQLMYKRYTEYHRLNNLLWVWNANAPRQRLQDEAFAYEDYYPGNEFVDVLGSDIYHKDFRQSHHDELVELGRGKIISIAEVGDVPPPHILDKQPYWNWFMIWSYFVDRNSPEAIRALYSSPRVLTFEIYKRK